MENQAMSSSSSSSPKPQKLKGLALEKDMDNGGVTLPLRGSNNPYPLLTIGENKKGSPQEVTSERSDHNSLFRSGIVRTGKEIMKFYPSKSNKIYVCNFCKKGFSTSQALGGHQNAHKHERDWERKKKEMEENFPGLAFLNPYLDKPHLLLGGYSQDALSNDNHLGITLEPFNSIGTRGNMDMNLAIVPRVTPTSFFSGNQSQGSSINPNHLRPLLPRNVTHFPPPRTNTVLSEENLISKIGMNNIIEIVEIDDDDEEESEEKKSKTSDIDLSLSL